MKSTRVVQTYINIFGSFSTIVRQMLMNFVQFFINTLLHFDFLKISLYDGVFSHSQLIILLKKYDGLGLFCSGYVCRAQKDHLHSGGPWPYILGAIVFFYKVDRNLTKWGILYFIIIITVLRSKKDHLYPHKSAKTK